MIIGFYAGSFDPFTEGHLHVVKRAALLVDKLIIGIGDNPGKKRRYNKEEMRNAINQVLFEEYLDNVSVVCYNNLTADAALNAGANILIRGIRNGMDYEYEENIASCNYEMDGIDTIYIRAGSLGNISSSFVVQLLNNGKNVSKYLPSAVLEYVNTNHI